MTCLGALSFIIPNFSDFQLLTPRLGEHKVRPYDTLMNLLGRGEVYPRPQRTIPCSNLLIGA
jgi:hypothetical protein